jgi:plastocyanin
LHLQKLIHSNSDPFEVFSSYQQPNSTYIRIQLQMCNMKIQSRLYGILIMLSVAFLLSCSKSDNNSSNNTTPNTVSINNMSFGPSAITVKAGTTVTWTNNDNTAHTVTADDQSFNSGNMNKGATFAHTFATAGTYPYHCTYHPMMTATVTTN